METISITLPTSKKRVDVRLDRKPMKTCRLKVYPSQEIVLSVPERVPTTWAEDFLIDKGIWIESKLNGFQKTVGYGATEEIIAIFKIKAYSRMNGTNPHSPVELQPEMHAESHLEEHPMSLL